MTKDFNIDLNDFNYQLPDDRIAKHGAVERQKSKLLIYDRGNVSDSRFENIIDVLPKNTTLFFNDTKVIQARIHMARTTGALIEIFLLSPHQPTEMAGALSTTKGCTWKCMIGNARKWKEGEILKKTVNISGSEVQLKAQLIDRNQRIVQFKWDSKSLVSFGNILDEVGRTPLPPYLNRKAEDEDKLRYQTVYSKIEGAVAAPTAGLHFTNSILDNLQNSNINLQYLTLHVSAGTFQPISVDNVGEHPMHNERVFVTKENIESILKSSTIIPVGTTSMRTLESLYWYGVMLLQDPTSSFHIEKLYPYQSKSDVSLTDSMECLLKHMEKNSLTVLSGDTEIFIFPGYKFRVCDALITNFHQPGSTLILLVAALIGDDWKKVYKHAMQNKYRFLSYGDSSILFPNSIE